MVVLIIFAVILQTVNNLIMLSIGGQGHTNDLCKKAVQFIYSVKVTSWL